MLERLNRNVGLVLAIAAKTLALYVIVHLVAEDLAVRLERVELPSFGDVVERLTA